MSDILPGTGLDGTRPEPVRALLFDMDGTLVDSTAVVESVWTDFAGRHDLDPRAVLAVVHGVPAVASVRRLLPGCPDVRAEVAIMDAQESSRTGEVVAIGGAADFVFDLPEDGWAVVTSAPRDLAVGRLQAAGIRPPPVLVALDDTPSGKPDPAGYLLAAARLGVPPAQAVVFEDAPAGLQAARAAGMRAVVVGNHAGSAGAGLPAIEDFTGLRVRLDPDTVGVRPVIRVVRRRP